MKYTALTPTYNGNPTDWDTIKHAAGKDLEPCPKCKDYFYKINYNECGRCVKNG